MANYLRPVSLDEALAALARPWTVLAGGTDFYPARVGRAIRLASISPVTTEAARRLGWVVAAEAEEYTWEGLVAAVVRAEAAKTD